MSDPNPFEVRKVAEADFPTEYGHFRIYGFAGKRGDYTEDSVAVAMGDLKAPEPLLVRIHSQCLTGDVFHSLRCDCRAQLELALETIGAEGRGMVIYEAKEGRGIGLLNKLRAYELQDAGADTVEANEQLGFEADLRGYEMPGAILQSFGIKSVRLMTNNPEKIAAMEAVGVQVAERVPCNAVKSRHSARYLKTKKKRLGHLLEL
ncbi:GTP cyclohydrolase II [uncultured Paludibaculum sp.]|uniref:GTP cyclohydrolase II n=1 Tax=uncultured Paludibaculum sp. TaxID=1765020 RepID=UPI002AAB6AD9|nr:GTP cyclohydrolase II [uncultured Paludibaculum sp.]